MSQLLFLLLISAIQIFFLFWDGYFLSPEFTVYPYLRFQGFLPYRELIDQHFPALFFGPLALPVWLTQDSTRLLILFIFLLFLTNLLLWLSLKNKSLLLIWVAFWLLLDGRVLWLEIFLLPLLLLFFLYQKAQSNAGRFLAGFSLGLVLLIKPTLLPFVLLAAVASGFPFSPYFLTGLVLPPLLSLVYLAKNQLLFPFWQIAFEFNRVAYLTAAAKPPSLPALVYAGFIFLPAWIFLLYRRRFLSFLIALSAVILAYPRFELFHLLPAALLALVFVGQELSLRPRLVLILSLPLLLLGAARLSRHRVGNFYATNQLKEVVAAINQRPGATLYQLGVSDLLYPLTGRIPPDFYYLPGLPWYLSHPDFQRRQIEALSRWPATLVLINPAASVDGVKIVSTASALLTFIRDHYQLTATVSGILFYQRL